MKTFAFGALAGASALAISVPLALGAAGAAMRPSIDFSDRPVPSQECLHALAAHEDSMLAGFDAMTAAHKSAMTEHRDALKAAAAIDDDAARGEALRAAHESMHEAMTAAMEEHGMTPEDMEAVHEECGDSMKFTGMRGPGGHRMMMKFGMFGHGPKAGPGDGTPSPSGE